MSNNNANMQRQFQELAKILEENKNDPAAAQKQAAPIVKAIEKLSNELKGKIGGSEQTQRETALNTIKTLLSSGSPLKDAQIKGVAKFATDAGITKVNYSDSGFAAMEKEYKELKTAFNNSVENYVEKASQKLLKGAMEKFETNTNISVTAKLDSIIKEYTTKMEEAARKASEKAAEKAYQESLAKMIAKFSKK